MITLNLTKEEIERLYYIWQRSWPMLDPDEEDTIGVKIQDAFIHRDDDIKPEHRYESEECVDLQIVINRCYGGFGLSKEAETWLAKRGLWEKYPDLDCIYDIPRHEPLLVECVKTLGDSANGMYAKLVVETVTSHAYYIDEYDGIETVVTNNDFIIAE